MTTPTADRFRTLACTLPGAEERDHMGSPSFRVEGKIFGQLADGETVGLVKMDLADQAACMLADPSRFWVPARWSKFGWTYVRLSATNEVELRRLLEHSWSLVAPEKLVAAPRPRSAEPA